MGWFLLAILSVGCVPSVFVLPPYGLLVSLVGLVIITAYLVRRIYRVRATASKWGPAYSDANALVRMHRLSEAQDLLEEQAEKVRTQAPHQHAFSLHILAVIARMQGDSQRAMDLLNTLMDSDVVKERANLLTSILPELHSELALALALAGDTDEAERRLETGRTHTSSVRVALLALPRVIILARRELWPLCLDFIAKNRDGIRSLLRPHDARAVALVEAFALSQLSGDAYREAAAVRRIEDALQDSRPHRPGEFDYLGSAWPEMRAFLAAHSKDPPIESANR